MKNKFYLLVIILLSHACLSQSFSVSADTTISSIVSRMNSDSIRSVIQNLQNFQTRFMLTDNRFQAAEWIAQRFRQLGITDVVKDSFVAHTTYLKDTTTLQYNIVATIEGTEHPDNIYIIGGHYDCYSYEAPYSNAPGADDNASGTACALEFARVLMESGYQPKSTIRFIAFGAEELMNFGDCGSSHYAVEAYNNNMKIKLMVNADMISYTSVPLNQSKVNLNYYTGFNNLLPIAIQAASDYSLITASTGSLNQKSDSYPFYEMHFPALYYEEYYFSPWYHSINDVLENYNIDYCREVIKSAAAFLLTMQQPITEINETPPPTDFVLYQNYPNPFNPETKISFYVPRSMHISVSIYDQLGREVAVLLDEEVGAGNKNIDFNAAAYNLSSGIYICKVNSANNILLNKMVLLK